MKKQNRLKILFLIIMGLMFIFSIFEFIEWLNEPEFKITKEECTNSPIFSYTETDVSNYTKKYNLKKDEVLDDVKILNFLEPEICVESLDEKCGNHLSGTYFFILDNIGEDSEKVYPYYDYYKKEGRIIDANFNEDKTLFTQKFISDYKINLEGISIMKNNGAISFYNANETTSIQVLYTIVKKYYSFKTIEDRKVCEQVEVDEIINIDTSLSKTISKEDLTIDWLGENAECIEWCRERFNQIQCPANEEVKIEGNYKCSKYKIQNYQIEVLK